MNGKPMLKISLSLLVLTCAGCATTNPIDQFQQDADLLRLEHLEYWTGLVEDYEARTGHYPLQQERASDEIVLVKIATRQQRKYLSSEGAHYNPELDINASGRFKELPVKAFVNEIESVMGHDIEEKYDIQKVPVRSPVGYFYFATADGYLIWVTCTTCGVTQISTLLGDGFTPTVNIVSEGMYGDVTKALPRDEMLNHAIYQQWRSRAFHKEPYVRSLVSAHAHDSEQDSTQLP